MAVLICHLAVTDVHVMAQLWLQAAVEEPVDSGEQKAVHLVSERGCQFDVGACPIRAYMRGFKSNKHNRYVRMLLYLLLVHEHFFVGPCKLSKPRN